MKKPVIFERKDLKRLRELIEDHIEFEGGMTKFEDILEDFDCKYILNKTQNFENFKGQVKDLVNNINESDRMEEFIKYMGSEFPTGKSRYYDLLEPYLEEPGYKLKINTEMKPVVVGYEGKRVECLFLQNSTLEAVKSFIINSGKTFEKLPETFSKFSEPVLRDIILAVLNSIFEGAATGETFSGSGKSDIHIQFSGYDSLIIECKNWDGEDSLNDALEQLFSYNTPNEGSGIIVMFSTRSDFDSIIEKAKTFLQKHSSYVSDSFSKSSRYIISKHEHPQIKSHKFIVHTVFFNLYHINTQKNPNYSE